MVGTGSSVIHPSALTSHELSLRLQIAEETLYWNPPYKTTHPWNFETGDTVWLPEGGLNASYNCVDR